MFIIHSFLFHLIEKNLQKKHNYYKTDDRNNDKISEDIDFTSVLFNPFINFDSLIDNSNLKCEKNSSKEMINFNTKLSGDILMKIIKDFTNNEIHRETNYSVNDYYLSMHILKIFTKYKFMKKICGEAYTKGVGIFCTKKQGFKANEYITGYYGEIYSPWLWFEKQDLIKSKKLETQLPDFYNIMLERNKFDIDGYNLVMVDPNSKGNFASRMSHSCVSNCNTVLMVSQGKYTIGMFATKDVSFGEELTFDYNSVTEKEQEFKDAICLCSTFSCRGNYLIFSKSMIFTEVLNKYHNFLQRNAILLYACSFAHQKVLTNKEKSLLEKYSIKNSILKDSPFWLKKWAVMILNFIELEAYLLPFYLYKAAKSDNFHAEEKFNYFQHFIKTAEQTQSKDENIVLNKTINTINTKTNSFNNNGSISNKKIRNEQEYRSLCIDSTINDEIETFICSNFKYFLLFFMYNYFKKHNKYI